MGGLGRRLERLEAASKGPASGRAVYLDAYLKELENIKRREAGAEPVPFTAEEEAYRREADRWFRDEYLPAQRERTQPGSPNRATVEALEARTKRAP